MRVSVDAWPRACDASRVYCRNSGRINNRRSLARASEEKSSRGWEDSRSEEGNVTSVGTVSAEGIRCRETGPGDVGASLPSS